MTEHWFDALSRLAVTGVSRRQALGWLGRRMGGLALAGLVPGDALAGAGALLAPGEQNQCKAGEERCSNGKCCPPEAQCEAVTVRRGNVTSTTIECRPKCKGPLVWCGQCCDPVVHTCCGTGSRVICCPPNSVCDYPGGQQNPKCVPAQDPGGDVFQSSDEPEPSGEETATEGDGDLGEIISEDPAPGDYTDCFEKVMPDSSERDLLLKQPGCGNAPKPKVLKGGVEWGAEVGTTEIQVEDQQGRPPISLTVEIADGGPPTEPGLDPDWKKWLKDVIGDASVSIHAPLEEKFYTDGRVHVTSVDVTFFPNGGWQSSATRPEAGDGTHARAVSAFIKNLKAPPFPKGSKLTSVTRHFVFQHNAGQVGIKVAPPPQG